MLPSTFVSTPTTPQINAKARQLYVNNGTTTTPLPNNPNANVIVPAANSSRCVKLEEILSKDNFQGLLEIDNSDWLISEDYKVLDAIQNIQQLPLSSISFSSTSNANKTQTMLPNASSTSLSSTAAAITSSSSLSSSLSSSTLLPSTATMPSSPSSSIVNNTTNALTQNWDFISDIVNRYSRVLRTPKQCKHRFEQVIGPREEGRVLYDPIKKKKHVIKGAVKVRSRYERYETSIAMFRPSLVTCISSRLPMIIGKHYAPINYFFMIIVRSYCKCIIKSSKPLLNVNHTYHRWFT
jgi:hypothetical protein